MEEGVVSNLVAKALVGLCKAAFTKAASWWSAQAELKKLEITMRLIQARVRDAERCQEDDSSDAIKEWLRRLKLVLYQADDLFNEVLTLHRQKLRMENSTVAKVGILFSKSGTFYYSRKLANEIKSIRTELDAIKFDMADLNLTILPSEDLLLPVNRLMKKRETASFVNTEDVVGRNKDHNIIVEMLFDTKYDDKKVTVIPIVGFGGLGKTTLAQLVLNDERVKQYFDLTKWAYVPEKDNLIVIMGKIFNSFTDDNYDNLSLDQIKRRIKESIEAKKYLLVLDDLWDEGGDRLIDLINLLKCGKQGSKVIVTTRSDVVARIVGTIDVPYKLGTLTDDQSWDLFRMLAFKQEKQDNNPSFSVIGKEIVNICGNVPLAIKVVGGFLSSKHTEKEWLQARDAQRSKAQLTKGNDIMDVLKLSYDYLPPALKQCFAYCSLFPKGYLLRKDDLVYLWMAQGYIEPSDKDIGDQHFLELLGRGFFQDPKLSGDGNVKKCKMHDLVYDLAQYTAGEEIKLLGDECSIQNSHGLVHVCALESQAQLPFVAKRMRSLFLIRDDTDLEGLISRFQYLRVLSVEDDMIKTLPNSIERLIHLRYLYIEGDCIEYLPSSLTRLENLQTLIINGCWNLRELPSDFTKLGSLRHLIIPEAGMNALNDLPSGFEKLSSLQVLNEFLVGKSNGIDALPSLNLKRKLKITFCEVRKNAVAEAQRANLKNSSQLTSLKLWLKELTPSFDGMTESLMHLQLPPNLRCLEVCHYNKDEMPRRWFDGLSKLVSIKIEGCKRCKVVPYLSQLPHLRYMRLRGLNELEYVEEEDNVGVGGDGGNLGYATHNIYFPSLEVLVLYDLPRLKGWTRASKDDGEGRQRQLLFPRLLEMTVYRCPELMSMPKAAPKLERLYVRHIKWEAFESNVATSLDDEEAAAATGLYSTTLFTSLKQLFMTSVSSVWLSISGRLCNLKKLVILECDEMRSLRFESPNSIRQLKIWCRRLRNIEGLQHLSNLETLDIIDCEELEMEEEGEEEEEEKTTSMRSRGCQWRGLSSLRSLRFCDISKWKKLPSGIACLTTLQELSIEHLNDLTELPQDIGNLSLLRQLDIWDCPELKSLPSSIFSLTSLQSLLISECPHLQQRYKQPDGEDCHLIQHISNISIDIDFEMMFGRLRNATSVV